jgi:hypothetical protein
VLSRSAAVIYLSVALMGRIAGPPGTLIVTGATCAVLMGVAWVAAWTSLRDHRPSRRSIVQVTATTFGAPFFAHGAAALDQWGALLTLLLLACCAGLATQRAASLRRSP